MAQSGMGSASPPIPSVGEGLSCPNIGRYNDLYFVHRVFSITERWWHCWWRASHPIYFRKTKGAGGHAAAKVGVEVKEAESRVRIEVQG